MSDDKWTEKAFPQNWAGIRLVPDPHALSVHGATPEGFFNLMDGYVQEHSRGLIKNPEPGVYCTPFFGAKPRQLERLFALMEALGESDIVRECAPDSLWTDPEEGTYPLSAVS